MENILIDLEGVTIKYTRKTEPTIERLTLKVEAGSVIVITGNNNSGKTTLLNIISGLIPHMHDATTTGKTEVIGTVGMCIQNSDVFLMPTVYEELKFVLKNAGCEEVVIEEKIREYTNLLGISHLLHQNMHELSGGERQKVAILCSCIDNRDIILFDEPLMQTDADFQKVFLLLIERLIQTRKVIIIASLDPNPFQVISTKVLLLKDKNINEHFLFKNPMYPIMNKSPLNVDTSILQVKNISYAHKKERMLLNDVSFSVKDSEIISIVGCNGSGKTTLLNLIMGIVKPISGEIYLYGKSITKQTINERSQYIGYLFQDPTHQLFQNEIIKEVSWGLDKLGLNEAEMTLRIEKWLEKLGLSDERHEHPYSVSQSMRKKVALAGVMVRDPKIIILDEPTHGFDADEKYKFIEIIQNISKEGTSVIIVTHDPIIKNISNSIITLGGDDNRSKETISNTVPLYTK